MKKTLLTLCAALLCVTFVSCGSDSDDGPENPGGVTPEFAFTNMPASSTVDFGSVAGTKELNFTTNQKVLINNTNDFKDWLTVTVGTSKMVLKVKANPSMTQDRTATVKYQAGSMAEKSFTVKQEKAQPTLSVTGNDIVKVTAEQESFKVLVDATVPFTVTIPAGVDWVALDGEATLNGDGLWEQSFALTENLTAQENMTTITITGNAPHTDMTDSFELIQEATTDPEIVPDLNDYTKLTVASGWASSFYASEPVTYSFDGSYDTKYHSHWSDADQMPVTLKYNFTGVSKMDLVVYWPRQDKKGTTGQFATNGNFIKVKVYYTSVPDAEDDDDYTFVGEYNLGGRNTQSALRFPETAVNPVEVKFVVEEGVTDSAAGIGFASCSEMEFYSRDDE